MAEKTSLLIVDDDLNFCNTLSKILSKKGYETTTAEGGMRALELIKERAFDVVLMDIKMPVISGVETYKKIKTIRPGTVTLLMTAFTVDDLIKDAIKEGVYAVVKKPLDLDLVVNMIEKAKNGALLAIVDDDPQITKTMKEVLEKKGYSVSTCATGEEAIALTKERPQDTIFIDMNLPVLNGLEVYLKIHEINPEATVVMMTAYRQEMDELIKQAMQSGAYACLYKPFDMNEAINIIDELSKKKHKD